MTGFDMVVMLVVGFTAVFGFLRGFVHEILGLAAWIVALLAVHFLHTPATEQLATAFSAPAAASVLAFALLLLIPYWAIKLLARWVGGATRTSVIGPVDRLLGLGFGALKGLIVIVLGFSVLVLGYDTIWGPDGRPDWLVEARSYAFVDASSNALVEMIGERREQAREAAAQRQET
jgi:membrane protein required for colicin V production